MTRVLHLLNHCKLGHGNVHVAVDLACTQAASGSLVMFASNGGHFEALLQASGVMVTMLSHNMRNPGDAILAGARIARLIRQYQIDVVHAHMMSGAAIGYLAARLCGRPLVTTVHNSFDWHARLMNIGDAVVAVSGAERRDLQRRGFKSSKLFQIWNGPLDSPRYATEPIAQPTSRRKTIVTVCGLHARKGVSDLIKAFAQIVSEAPDWHLSIVGDGPDKEKLTAQCRDLGITWSTTFYGTVTDPMPILASAEIFVLASLAEPFGLAAVEARAAGCAIITTDVGGLPEIMDYGSAGILVRAGAPQELAAALRRLIFDAQLRVGFQTAAVRNLQRFSVSRLADDYEAVYRNLNKSEPSLS